MNKNRLLLLKIIILFLVIVVFCSFWLSGRSSTNQITATVTPVNPQQDEPIMVTFRLNNVTDTCMPVSYVLYANGRLITNGETILAAKSSELYRYAYRNQLPIGEQVTFLIEAQSSIGKTQQEVSVPAYPPQVLTSMVSIAAASLTMINSITVAYYGELVNSTSFNLGALFILVLISCLIFLELFQPAYMNRTMVTTFGTIRLRFSLLSWILLIIFFSLIYTRIVLIISNM